LDESDAHFRGESVPRPSERVTADFLAIKTGFAQKVMKRLVLIYLCTITLGCVEKSSVDYRNFAIDTYFPTPNEIRLAEARARNYWSRNASRFEAEPRYLAVQTSTLFPGEIQDLYPKLINSETTASFLGRGDHKGSYSELDLHGIMIYDTKTGHFVSNQGYVSVDTPPYGGVARFGQYMARYIRTGSWSPF